MASATKNYAEDVLRQMYGGSLPREAAQLLRAHGSSKGRSSSAPPQKWSTGLSERPRERRRVDLRVPRVGARKSGDPGRPPSLPGTGKKPLSHILLETCNYERQDEMQPSSGRDYDEDKRRHQDRCAYGFGSALPTVMEPRSLAQGSGAGRAKPRVTFATSLPPSREGSPRRLGLTSEQERLAAEIVDGVRERQRELDHVEVALADCTVHAETPGEGVNARRRVLKEMEGQSKRRLELKNAIARDIKDLEKLMDLTPED
mmetsp:Transcript_82986/g.257748  ORF Transcript_82986/g.257748 Transcript_82986/m.257748 type:complete len:259 (+) Transcript_82986:126-902(+)